MRAVYLDNNATTPVLPEVFEAMAPYFLEYFGNPSSIHGPGREALAAMKKARASVAQLLGARATEIVFTSGGTEGDNLAIAGMVSPGDHIVTSAIEHTAVTQACRSLERLSCETTRVPVDGTGRIDPADVRRALRTNTRLISVMLANNETGVVQPVEEIGRIAAEADVWFHIDAVQGAGKLPIPVDRIGCDLLTISGHKIHGPKGIGALYVRRGTSLRPLVYGGRQENGRRPGTENLPGIVGLGRACEIAREGLCDGAVDRMGALRDRLEAGVICLVPDTGISGNRAPRVPNTTNIYFDGVAGDALVLALDEQGIAVSRGAACHSGEAEPSSVLMAMGLSGERSRSSLRFSLGKQTVDADIDWLLATLPEAVRRCRTDVGRTPPSARDPQFAPSYAKAGTTL
jgi:cysteine desulfurase